VKISDVSPHRARDASVRSRLPAKADYARCRSRPSRL
jgi:hypothetical protein